MESRKIRGTRIMPLRFCFPQAFDAPIRSGNREEPRREARDLWFVALGPWPVESVRSLFSLLPLPRREDYHGCPRSPQRDRGVLAIPLGPDHQSSVLLEPSNRGNRFL